MIIRQVTTRLERRGWRSPNTCRAPVSGLLAILAASLLIPSVAEACAVCYGDADSLMTKGMNYGILVLLGVVASVQIGFVTLFLSIRQRARRERLRRARFRVIQGGAG